MNQDVFDTVKKYYADQLSQAERNAFETKIREDAGFAKEAQSYARMQEVILQYGDQQLNEELSEMGKKLIALQHQENLQSNNHGAKVRTFTPKRWIWMAAAAVILVLLVAIPLLNNNTPASPQDLFAANYTLPAPPTVRGETSTEVGSVEELWQKAAQAYGIKNFDTAALLFEEVINDSSSTRKSEAWLFLGITLIELNQPEKAIEAFEMVSETSISIDDANWYLALSFLKLNQPERSRELLEKIMMNPPDPRRKEQVESILKQLSKP